MLDLKLIKSNLRTSILLLPQTSLSAVPYTPLHPPALSLTEHTICKIFQKGHVTAEKCDFYLLSGSALGGRLSSLASLLSSWNSLGIYLANVSVLLLLPSW